MVNRDGIPRIQEERDGQIKLWTLDGWNEELKKRREAAKDQLREIDQVKDEVEEQIENTSNIELPDNQEQDDEN